ncbi:uncharacterized protein [Physcomitrium patens]|nr:uncharacterized protein LOC112282917 [Physcomitrium patens]|eukprot:XP_024376860.1 uncharacterized protein LOC112282917 [Physcomitrella patens]
MDRCCWEPTGPLLTRPTQPGPARAKSGGYEDGAPRLAHRCPSRAPSPARLVSRACSLAFRCPPNLVAVADFDFCTYFCSHHAHCILLLPCRACSGSAFLGIGYSRGGFGIRVTPEVATLATIADPVQKRSETTSGFMLELSDTEIPASFDPFAEANVEDSGVGSKGSGYVHVRVQQRNGRKSLTTVQGLKKEFNYNKILKDLKKEFCCNGVVVQDPELGQVIQLQGDQRKNVSNFLVQAGIVKKDLIKIHGF